MTPSPDIIKDFSALQAANAELGKSNLDLLNQVASLKESNIRLAKQRDEALNAGGFCGKHFPSGGMRTCLVCATKKLTHTLEQIDYALSEPNEMGVSDYALHYNEEEVLRKVKELVANNKKYEEQSIYAYTITGS